MKKLLFAVVLFASVTLSSFAQDSNNKAEEIATKQTEWMKENLDLSVGQLEKIEDLNLEFAKKMTKVQETEGKLNKLKQAKSIAEEKDGKMKDILNEVQYEKYQDKKSEMRSNAKEMFKNRESEIK